jgi:hypothetical protein
MTTEAEDALPDLFEARGEVGEAGFRVHSATIVAETYTGHTGESLTNIDEAPLVEGGGYNPKVRWLKDEEIAVGNLAGGTIEVGPITPAFAVGGTDLDTLMGELDRGATRHVRIVGPKHPNGARYRITEIRAERPLRYIIRAVPVSSET